MSGRSGLSWRQRHERGGEKSAEAIVVGVHRAPLALLLADEGPNPLLQGAVGTISMNVEQQPSGCYQRLLFEEPTENPRHARGGKGGTRPSPREESQTFAANEPARALTQFLMEEMTDRENLNRAYRQVKANRGASGVDGMTIAQGASWIAEHKEELIASLIDGSYQPQPVRGVQIPKPGGGVRQLAGTDRRLVADGD